MTAEHARAVAQLAGIFSAFLIGIYIIYLTRFRR